MKIKLLGRTIFEISKALEDPTNWGAAGWRRILEPNIGAWQNNTVEMTQSEVLSFPTVYAAITLISNQLAKLPLCLKEYKDGTWKYADYTNPAYKDYLAFLESPTTVYSRYAWSAYLFNSTQIDGNAYGLKHFEYFLDATQETGYRRVLREVRLLEPGSVRPLINDDGEVFYEITSRDKLNNLTGTVRLPADAIVHWPYNPLYHPLIGCSPLRATYNAALTGTTILERERDIHSNRPRKQGILEMPAGISPEQARDAKALWDETMGPNGTGSAVLLEGVKFNKLEITAEEAETIQAANLTNQMVLSGFGVPPYLVGVGPIPSAANSEVLLSMFTNQTLQPIIQLFEETLDAAMELPDNLCVEVDTQYMARLDTTARYEANTKAMAWQTINEVRACEGLEPIEGGDTIYMQQQDFPLHEVMNNVLPDQRPATDPVVPDGYTGETDQTKGVVMRFREVWKSDTEYNKGDVVQCDGTIWVATKAHKARTKPGSSDEFRLIVKSGY